MRFWERETGAGKGGREAGGAGMTRSGAPSITGTKTSDSATCAAMRRRVGTRFRDAACSSSVNVSMRSCVSRSVNPTCAERGARAHTHTRRVRRMLPRIGRQHRRGLVRWELLASKWRRLR